MASKKSNPRGRYRTTYRRLRLYLPVLLLIFVAMVLFLPLSARWMASRAESIVAKRFGVAIEVERLQFTVSRAEAEAVGIVVPSPTGASPPFEIRRVHADGDLEALLAGGDHWPQWVIVDSPSRARLVRTAEGLYEPSGPLKSLVDAILAAAPPPRESGGPSTVGRTPQVMIRNLLVEIDPPRPVMPPAVFQVDQLVIHERHAARTPISATAHGKVSVGTREAFSLAVELSPEERILSVRGSLSGWPVIFNIPGLGEFDGRIGDVAVEIDGALEPGGNYILAASITAQQWTVGRRDLRGERWNDGPVQMRVRATFDPRTRRIEAQECTFLSQQAEIHSSGDVTLGGAFPGSFMVRIARLPPAAVALGRGELFDRLGVRLGAGPTTPTLELSLEASGKFAEPLGMDVSASVKLGGWRVEAPGLPQSVFLDRLEASASPTAITLAGLECRYGGAELRASGTMPVVPAAEAAGLEAQQSLPGEISTTLTGDAREAFELLQDLELLPREVSYAALPIRLTARVPVIGVKYPGVPLPAPMPRRTLPPFVLTWGEGKVGLWHFTEPVTLLPGDARYREGRFSLGRFRARLGDVAFRAEGDIEAALKDGVLVLGDCDLRVISEGDLKALGFLVGREVALPRELPGDLDGHYRLEAEIGGAMGDDAPLAAIEGFAYRARLLLDGASATLALGPRSVSVHDLSAELVLDRESLQIRRIHARARDTEHGNSEVAGSGTISATEARLFGDVQTHLEFISTLFPEDLADVYLSGNVAGKAEIALIPSEPLPEAPDLVRRWLAYVSRPGMRVSVHAGAPLILDYELRASQDEPIVATPRDFPMLIENVRGVLLYRPGYLEVSSARADVGSSKNIAINTDMHLFERPVRINIHANVPGVLDTNEWMEGWGEQPWAESPVLRVPSFEPRLTDEVLVIVEGDIDAAGVRFMQFDMGRTTSHFAFLGSRVNNPRLELTDLSTTAYAGAARGAVKLEFPRDGMPIVRVDADFSGLDLQAYMDVHLERPQRLDGVLEGRGNFEGQLLNYPTYAAQATFSLSNSTVIGSVIFEYARDLLQATSTTGGRDSRSTGAVLVRDEKIFFEDLVISNPNVNLAADGYIDFRANLFFDVTANMLTKRLEGIPIVGLVGNMLNAVGDQLVSYRVRGTLYEPSYSPIPTVFKHLRFLERRERPSDTPVPERRN